MVHVNMFGIALLALGLGAMSVLRAEDEGPLGAGKEAPELKADGWLNGAAPKPEDLKGKVVVIDFFAFW